MVIIGLTPGWAWHSLYRTVRHGPAVPSLFNWATSNNIYVLYFDQPWQVKCSDSAHNSGCMDRVSLWLITISQPSPLEPSSTRRAKYLLTTLIQISLSWPTPSRFLSRITQILRVITKPLSTSNPTQKGSDGRVSLLSFCCFTSCPLFSAGLDRFLRLSLLGREASQMAWHFAELTWFLLGVPYDKSATFVRFEEFLRDWWREYSVDESSKETLN
jgi:hypothetical protein